MKVRRLPGGANFSLPCGSLRCGNAVALKPVKRLQFGVSGGRASSALLAEPVVDDTAQCRGFGYSPALGKPLEIPSGFRIQTVSRLDGSYGHTFQNSPFAPPVKRMGS